MPTDYDKVYQEKRHALGKPTKEFVAFFDAYDKPNADVLDIGCGQGRDALHIARRGHHVVGVDLSPTGIMQLLEDAQAEGLHIEGIVADLREYQPAGMFDVVVIDRTLHMLNAEAKLQVLERIGPIVRVDGFILIADEKSNLPTILAFFEADSIPWMTIKHVGGYLFIQRTPPPTT